MRLHGGDFRGSDGAVGGEVRRLAQGCGGALSGFYSMDIRDPHHTVVRQMPDARTGKPTLEPARISENLKVPDPAAIANGVVFALATGENMNQRGGTPARLQNTQPARSLRSRRTHGK